MKYLTTAETAKLVRKALKAEFAGQKFSVRSSVYAGGSSITVSWVDGVYAKDVDAVIKQFSGASFDGMIDLKYHYNHWMCEDHGVQLAEVYGHSYESVNGAQHALCCEKAEIVSFGADFVFSSRYLSDEYVAASKATFAKLMGREHQTWSHDDDRVLWQIQGGTWEVWSEEGTKTYGAYGLEKVVL